jgi:hypothetical protein
LRLRPIGDEQQRGIRKRQVPTRPNCGLEGSA